MNRFAQKFRNNTSGNVTILFALSAIPFFFVAGMAIDTARHGYHQQSLSTALDAAALGVAKMQDGASAAEKMELARAYIDINYTNRGDLNGADINLEMEETRNTITLSAAVDMPTTISRISGVLNLPTQAVSQVTKQLLGTEIALVLDNTGSMRNSGKIQGLRAAADTLLDVMFAGASSSNQVKIAIVPFSAAVNVGADKATASWLDINGLSTVSGLNFRNTNWHNMKAWTRLAGQSWNGCIEARAMPNDILDTNPDITDPDTLFTPYFAPDEPDVADSGVTDKYDNDYIDDKVGDPTNGKMDTRQRRKSKYVGASVIRNKGPGYNCAISPLTPLTNVEFDLRKAIDNMVVDGTTNITQGITWGWHVLSPTAPFQEGKPYSDKGWRKYIIVMTDGDNTWPKMSNHNGTKYTGYGFVAQGRLGITSSSDAKATLDARTAQVCTNVKDARTDPSEKITIYSITFGNPATSTRDMMEACASDPGKYHHAYGNAALRKVFSSIADDIGSVRLSR